MFVSLVAFTSRQTGTHVCVQYVNGSRGVGGRGLLGTKTFPFLICHVGMIYNMVPLQHKRKYLGHSNYQTRTWIERWLNVGSSRSQRGRQRISSVLEAGGQDRGLVTADVDTHRKEDHNTVRSGRDTHMNKHTLLAHVRSRAQTHTHSCTYTTAR